jgi:hypothetical protein
MKSIGCRGHSEYGEGASNPASPDVEDKFLNKEAFMVQIVVLAMILFLASLGCGGGSSSKSKMVKVDPTAQAQATIAPTAGVPKPAGHSFAYMLAMAGGCKIVGIFKDLPRDEFVRKYDKNFRYREKTIRAKDISFLQVVGQAATLGLMPAGIGAASTFGNIARAAGGAAITGATVGSSRPTPWHRKIQLAQVMPWMPESEAKTPEEAAAKMLDVLQKATAGVQLSDSVLIYLPKPVLVNNPPAVVIDATDYIGKVWTWSKGPGILFSASKIDPKKHKVFATNDDVSTWTRISEHLPRWCFVYLNGRLAGNGQYFIGYPIVFWQGKANYFGS